MRKVSAHGRAQASAVAPAPRWGQPHPGGLSLNMKGLSLNMKGLSLNIEGQSLNMKGQSLNIEGQTLNVGRDRRTGAA
jgi:hypothetical protein